MVIAGECYREKVEGVSALRKLRPLEEKIYNAGERLIPGVTHDVAESVRHRNSYLFFRQVIEIDAASRRGPEPLRIIDLGCGVGHGCETLSKIPNSHITGIDNSPESIKYAKQHYARSNITYQVADLLEYIPQMAEYDYVVSRGVLEHVPNGLQIALSTRWRCRLIIDVPYDEPGGVNPHHVLHRIREESFAKFPQAELFFQDLDGVIYDLGQRPPKPNTILCVCSRMHLPKAAATSIKFPFLAWQPPFYMKLRRLRKYSAVRMLIRTLRSILARWPR